MNTAKKGVRLVAEACRRNGIRKVVFSPGSRSAPLVIAFSQMPEIECLVIPDERVAGYFALGMAQQLHETVAVVCTSGTAALNLGPAICEAFYQQIPLLIITADRPPELIGIGENQAIVQKNIFKNYIKESFTLPVDAYGSQGKISSKVAEAIRQTSAYTCGPVHINLPLREPLYGMAETTESADRFPIITGSVKEHPVKIKLSKKNLIIAGMLPPDSNVQELLGKLSRRKDTVVIAETTSNTYSSKFISNVDAALSLIKEEDAKDYCPQLIITLGGQIVSKRIKDFLRKNPPERHVHVSSSGLRWNSLGAKRFSAIRMSNAGFLAALNSNTPSESDFSKRWLSLNTKASRLSKEYISKIEFSDLKVFETLVRSFPRNANIQYGNSSPVRYSNLFDHKLTLSVNSNRGTSGIDGCLAAAAGAAYANKQTTIAVVGDITFFYGSNALWHNYLSPDLRIIVINNSGGNIFRLIDGPTRVNEFEKFFETRHNLSAKHIASMYAVPYYFCDSQSGLEKILKTFYQPQNGKPAILEIKTDGILSAKVYKEYFEFLKNG